jgi:hypothetical protein
MTRISNVSNLLFGTTAGAIASLALQSIPASAANLTFSSTVNSGSPTGLALAGGGNFLSTDVFSLSATGTANYAGFPNPAYVTNAAGVTTQAYTGTPNIPVGGSNPGANNATAGALLIGNGTIGYFQLFPTNATNGLGSGTPPNTVSFSNITLASIFGTALNTTPTSSLNIITNDTVYADNVGVFTLNGSIAAPSTAVPEPFTIIGTLVGGTAAVRLRKKLQAVNK